jgi:recombination protein RecR
LSVLERVIDHLSRLPGIGRKSATRIAYYVLQREDGFAEALSSELVELKRRVKRCSECGSYTESDPCSVCTDPNRDRSTICVVEQPQDVAVLDGAREFRGLYHVLGGVISPIDGIGPENLSIGKLVERVRREETTEVILATNPTVEGDTTALYIQKLFGEDSVRVSRLALGLPVGGDLEYADRLTLVRSLRARTPMQ